MNDSLLLIAKYEAYLEYELTILFKIPKVAKYSVGNEFKNIMLEVLKNIYLLSKVKSSFRLDICNNIDACIAYQRSLLRIMCNEKYITKTNLKESMKKLGEIGAMLGGYIKSLGIDMSKKSLAQ